MCGIAGVATGRDAAPVDRRRLRAMAATLAHRGPDDSGLHAGDGAGLVSRRLAVLDPAHGRQPFSDHSGDVRAVLNGEIYNHRQLRAELTGRGCRFRSACDAEVVPHLYAAYGPAFVHRLEGMFALAVWDQRRRRLVLARDRLGVKPLYYAVQADTLTFGSEIKALLAADVKTTVDAQAVSDFLSLMYVPGSRSVFAEVSKLPPASVLVWDDDGYRVHRYWDLAQRARPAPVRAAAARHRLRELITASVDAQLAADVPVGFFLSGGVDSGTVVAAARAARPDQELRTFSVGFTDPSYDERRAAAAVARRFGCRHTDLVVRPRADDIAGGMATSFDEPFADPSMIPTYYLCRLARAHVTVALSGDGGDELFAGYATYQADKLARYYRRLPRTLTAGAVPALVGLLPRSERRMPLSFRARRFADNAVAQPGRSHYLWRVVLSEQRKAALLHPDVAAGLEDTYATHEPHYRDGAHLDPLTRFQYTDARVYLVDDVLTKVDRASMAHSLEVRVPLLATPVVEYAFSLPGRLKMPGLRTKKLLRDAMRGTLPPGVLRARKRGFNAPLAQWLRTDLRPLVEDFLAPDLVRRHGYLRAPAISAMVGRHLRADADHSRELWAALVLSMWAERHGAPR